MEVEYEFGSKETAIVDVIDGDQDTSTFKGVEGEDLSKAAHRSVIAGDGDVVEQKGDYQFPHPEPQGKGSGKTKPSQLEIGDQFYGYCLSGDHNPNGGGSHGVKGTFEMTDDNPKGVTLKNLSNGKVYRTSRTSIQILNHQKEKNEAERRAKDEAEKAQRELEKQREQERKEKELEDQIKDEEMRMELSAQSEEDFVDFEKLQPFEQLKVLVQSGMQNIWMVGAAGSGKSTMGRLASLDLNLPYLCISCGIGTSAAEFVGYKYPTREATKFAEFYAKPSIILIDEMTALDPAVAQVLNAALANGEIETTTGLVKRHPQCVIIATSNTYGTGASRQYTANNQLDASTIDRFVGATIEVDYSEEFEKQYDPVVIDFVYNMRRCITANQIRRIASTRMIQAGTTLRNKAKLKNWRELLYTNWTSSEKTILKDYLKKNKDTRLKELKSKLAELKGGTSGAAVVTSKSTHTFSTFDFSYN